MNISSIDSLNLNALRILEAVFEEGSASRAAIRLNMTQSAVSAGIRQLRRIYSDPLFVRTALVPGGRLRFRQTNSQMVTEMLVSRDIDLSITAGGISNDILQHESVGSGTYGCLVDPASYKAPFDLENYVHHEHILVGYGGFYGVVDEVLGRRGYKRFIRVSTSHFAAVPYFLKGTDSIITMPRHAAKSIAEITPLEFHECPIAYPVYPVELGFRRSAEKDPILRKIVATLRRHLSLLL